MNEPNSLEPVQAPVILVIQENSIEFYLWQRYATSAGLQFLRASTEREAHHFIQQAGPDLVVLDLGLYDEGWRTFLSDLKSDPQTRTIPVLVCSTSEEELLKMTSLADDYLRKPVLYDDFLTALDGLGVKAPDSR